MKKILLIEDNDNILDNTAEILEMANYHVVTAKNGKEGTQLAMNGNIDLIICDVAMPEVDGYAVMSFLKERVTTKDIPFIFLSARTEKTDIRNAIEKGAIDYICKPFDGSELLEKIFFLHWTNLHPDLFLNRCSNSHLYKC